MKMLSKRQMDKRRLTNMTTTSAAAVFFLHFLFFLLFSINTSPASATTIKGPPTAERKQLKRIVRVGEHLKLPCQISGSQPMSFEWKKDNEQIKTYAWPRFKTQKKNLKIRPVEIEDTGIYHCKGTNGFGSEEIRIDLIVIDPSNFPELEDGQIPDSAPPVLTQETMEHRSAWRKNAGDNFKLTCEALGKPDPEIIWYKNGVEMLHSSGYNIGSSGSSGKAMFTIKNLKPTNAGMYTCRAKNTEGSVSRNFTLDVIPSKDDIGTNENIPGSMTYDTIHDLANLHEGGLVMPSGPENTTVYEGDKAVLECRVHSSKKSNIMWLKRLDKEEESDAKNVNIIPVGQDKFKIIQKKKQSKDEVKVNALGVEILNTMEIPQSSIQDSGMYICFVKNPSGFKFKSAYLTVIPKPIDPNTDSGANDPSESRSILILVGCLAVVVMVLIATIITCFLKKRQKKAAHSSNTSSSSGSENSPELTENLMRQQHHQQQSHPNFNPSQHYTTNGVHQQQAMQRNLMQQQNSLYQQPYHQQQQMIYSQQQQQPQQRMQLPSHANNNHRNAMNGQMSILVNKMADTPLPPAPAPPPPPPSLHNEWNPNSLYNGGGSGSVATDSIVDAGVPVVNMYNTNLHHHLQQQNQYEVPHAHTRFVPGGPSSNDKGGSLFDPGSQRHIYNPRSHY